MKKKISIIILIVAIAGQLKAQRLKDIAFIQGEKSVQLFGYGLVVGLARTGDSQVSQFTVQSISSMLKKFGITVPEANIRTRNVAAVMVTATIDAFLKPGTKFDVVVSSIGDARSLQGGTLLLTPLTAYGGTEIYAFAQGPLSVGGYDYSTPTGSRIARNHVLTGRVPQGGIIQASAKKLNLSNTKIKVFLKTPDLTTVNNIVTAINQKFQGNIAKGIDPSEINVNIPSQFKSDPIKFFAQLEDLNVQSDYPAKVVLNERTGTVVAGENVKIRPVTISHGGMNIIIRNYPIISQPGAFSNGRTVVMDNIIPYVQRDSTNAIAINGATTVQEVAKALNSLKVSPRDIIEIFQALKAAGALIGDLVIL